MQVSIDGRPLNSVPSCCDLPSAPCVAGPVDGSRSHRLYRFRVGWHGWLVSLQHRLASSPPSPVQRRHWRWSGQHRRNDSHFAPPLGVRHGFPTALFPTAIPTATPESPPSPSGLTCRGAGSPPVGLPELGDSCHRPVLANPQFAAPVGPSRGRSSPLQPADCSGGVRRTEDDDNARCPPQGHRRPPRGEYTVLGTVSD